MQSMSLFNWNMALDILELICSIWGPHVILLSRYTHKRYWDQLGYVPIVKNDDTSMVLKRTIIFWVWSSFRRNPLVMKHFETLSKAHFADLLCSFRFELEWEKVSFAYKYVRLFIKSERSFMQVNKIRRPQNWSLRDSRLELTLMWPIPIHACN